MATITRLHSAPVPANAGIATSLAACLESLAARGRAANTIAAYRDDLQAAAQTLTAPLDQITPTAVVA